MTRTTHVKHVGNEYVSSPSHTHTCHLLSNQATIRARSDHVASGGIVWHHVANVLMIAIEATGQEAIGQEAAGRPMHICRHTWCTTAAQCVATHACPEMLPHGMAMPHWVPLSSEHPQHIPNTACSGNRKCTRMLCDGAAGRISYMSLHSHTVAMLTPTGCP